MTMHRVPALHASRRRLVVALVLAAIAIPAAGMARQTRPPRQAGPLPEIDEADSRRAKADDRKSATPTRTAPAGLPFFSGAARGPVSGAGDADIDAVAEEQRYRDCLALAGRDPDAAFDRAFRWKTDGGGLPADHCIAVALISIGRPAVAADRFRAMLEELKRGRGLPPDPLGGPASIDLLAAQIYDQMGNAWLLADDPTQAIDAFDRALAILPAGYVRHELELYLDRARAQGLAGFYEDAIGDLDRAEAIDPERAEIFLLRASAERILGRHDDAARDLARALELRAEWPEALLERANLNAARGQFEKARSDWLKVVTRWPDHPAAEAARTNLARLDTAAGTQGEKRDKKVDRPTVQPCAAPSCPSAAPNAAHHSSRTSASGSDSR